VSVSKRTKKRRKTTRVEPSRPIEVLTIGWMLTVVTTLVCELAFVLVRSMNRTGQPSLSMLAGLLLFAALVSGLVVLVMTPVVLRGRRQPPPRAVTIVSLVIAAAPLVLVALEVLREPK
jgi:hypothetical protein